MFGSRYQEDVEIPDINIELTLLDHIKERIRLAKRIDAQQHRVRKQRHERRWLQEAAEAMEIELDSDVVRLVSPLYCSAIWASQSCWPSGNPRTKEDQPNTKRSG